MGNSSQENGHLGYQPHRAVRDLGRTQVTLPHSHITGRGRSTAINAEVLTVSREPGSRHFYVMPMSQWLAPGHHPFSGNGVSDSLWRSTIRGVETT